MNHFDKQNALRASVIGFEFEFYSDMVRGRIGEKLSKLLGKKILVTDAYHSGIEVNKDQFKLEADYSGGSSMNELVTGPLPYEEAIPIMIKVLKWIGENGWTDDRCAFQFNVSFDKMRRDVKGRIETMDKLKFLLGIDEGLIYSKFGERNNSVYARSVKKVVPLNKFSTVSEVSYIDPKMFKIPDQKYYGVNFTKSKDGYLEIRYLGGRDYEKKISKIREVIEYVVLYMYDSLNGNTDYTKEHLQKLNALLKEYKKVVESFSNPNVFFMNFPDLHLMVDLKGFDENLKTYFPVIKDKVFDLIVEGNVSRGMFNYDTSNGRYQLKDAKIRSASNVEGLDLINCDIKNSNLTNCNFYGCSVNKCQIFDSILETGNKIASSKVQETEAKYTNVLDDCYVSADQKIIDCEMKGGILRKANLGRNARLDEKVRKVISPDNSKKFISDSRLKDVNAEYSKPKFGDLNWKYKKY
jgi:hypothetical protein